MVYDVVLAPGALADLQGIFAYVARRGGIERAQGYDKRLRAACLSLAEFPYRGTPRDDLAPGLRSIAFERRATIFYQMAEVQVRIVRVLHGGREAAGAFG